MHAPKFPEPQVKTVREWIVFAGGQPVQFDHPQGEGDAFSPATLKTACRFPDQISASRRAAPLLARGHVVSIAQEGEDRQNSFQEAKEKNLTFKPAAPAPKPNEFIILVDGTPIRFNDLEGGTDFERTDRANATIFLTAATAFRRAEALLSLSHSVAVEELLREKEFIVFCGGQPVRFLNDGGRGMAFELTDQASASKFPSAISAHMRGSNLAIKGHIISVGEIGSDGEKLFEQSKAIALKFKQSLREPNRKLGPLEAVRHGFAY